MESTIDNNSIRAENNQLRIHRAKSWLRAANQYSDDDDVAFITLWIAFNACYANENLVKNLTEKETFHQFINKLVFHDKSQTIYDCLWYNFSDFVKALINSHFVFEPFWRAQREGGGDWEKLFSLAKRKAYQALSDSDVSQLLIIVLERLYVLRNQIVHGGATYQSGVNRDQVKNGKRFLLTLMPIVIKLIEGEMNTHWGRVSYPVITD